MANKNFVVKNGLTVGNVEIDATTGNVTTSGNISTAFLYTDNLFYSNGTPYIGPSGFAGSKGDTGYAGSRGDTGFVGSFGNTGYTGSKGDTGLGFSIAKSYNTESELLADTSPTGIVAGQFAIVETGNVEMPENSKLYLWSGSAYSYVTDLSGAAGITGPQGSTGFVGSQGSTGYDGSQGDVGFTGSRGYLGSVGYSGSVGYVGSQGVLTNWTIKTANYTAQNGDRILADTSSGTFTITLPATPNAGDFVEISDANNFYANALYVNRNGSTIENQAIDLEVNVKDVGVQLLYDGLTWQVITNAGIQGNVGYTGSRGNPGGNGYTITSVSSNTTLTANTKVLVNTDSSSITLTLPVSAALGDEVFIIDGTGNASVNPITISRNGHKIQGLAENMTVSTDRAAFGLTYYNVTHGWVLNNV